jgi:hypothetical protein
MADLRESLPVAAPADAVYELLADLPRMGEWSPECEQVTWRNGATSSVKGAQFWGHNRVGSLRWVTQGQIVVAEVGRHLAFEITFGPLRIARWEYFIVPNDTDPCACTVVEEWTDRRHGWYRATADRAFGSRAKANHRGMVETLANLKTAAEAATEGGPVKPT